MVASYAWATPGGILDGTNRLANSFMQYPLQLDAARRDREAQELAAKQAEENAMYRRMSAEMNLSRFIGETGEIPTSAAKFDPTGASRHDEQARSAKDIIAARQAEENVKRQITRGEGVASGFIQPEGPQRSAVADVFSQVPGLGGVVDAFTDPSHEQRIAEEGSVDRASRLANRDAQTAAMLREKTAGGDLSQRARRVQLTLGHGFVPSKVTPPPREELFLNPKSYDIAIQGAKAEHEKAQYLRIRHTLPDDERAYLDELYGFAPAGMGDTGQPAPVITPEGQAALQQLMQTLNGFD